MKASYTIRSMTPAEVALAVDWAAQEGWNPGLEDVSCFSSVDPDGFIGGFLDGQMIASISVVNYDAQFAFLGFYIVTPEHRGQGYGYRLWQQAIQHAGPRLVGLDGVVAEQDNYRRSGFELAYRNIRYGGPARSFSAASRAEEVEVKPLDEVSSELMAFDLEVFPAPRAEFLQAWLGAPGHVARAAYVDGALAGYGVIRPCRAGYKVGPLFATQRAVAETLLAELLAASGAIAQSAEVYLDVPEPNREAAAMAQELGLAPVFETARMYTGAAPTIRLDRIFGVSSFELG